MKTIFLFLLICSVGSSSGAAGVGSESNSGGLQYNCVPEHHHEGFIRNGKPVASAVAIAGLASAAEAQDAALKGCEAARKGGAACVTVLEIAPAP